MVLSKQTTRKHSNVLYCNKVANLNGIYGHVVAIKMRAAAVLVLLSFANALSQGSVAGKRLSMKVVKEPTNYGMNLFNQEQPVNPFSLKTRVPAANFSGPPHLRQLLGKCYSKLSNDYKYKLCPFNNITQLEQTMRWNPFHGVLGVWQQWVIENNTFVAMMMQDGDSCGELYRSTKVELGCGNKTEIISISEPETCSYLLQFNTPLVCDPRSLLVYPTLPEELQEEWNVLEGMLMYGDVTQKGYDKQLRSIFVKAGFISLPEQRRVQRSLHGEEEKKRRFEEGQFDSLMQCQEEYRKIKAQLTELKTVLETTNTSVSATDGNSTGI